MQRLLTASRQFLPAAQRAGGLAELQRAGGSLSARWFSSAEDDSHDDFKPKIKAAPSQGVEDTIQSDISSHDVFIYMKGIPQAPMCGFSNMACAILNLHGVEYGARNVLEDPEIREGIKKFTAWPTIPQVFIKGEFIGGSDILHEMHQKGELSQLLKDVKRSEQ